MTAESLYDLVARLADLSKSATAGPYFRQSVGVYLAEGGLICETRCVSDAKYFAAIPPETVTALLDEIVALRARAETAEALLIESQENIGGTWRQRRDECLAEKDKGG